VSLTRNNEVRARCIKKTKMTPERLRDYQAYEKLKIFFKVRRGKRNQRGN